MKKVMHCKNIDTLQEFMKHYKKTLAPETFYVHDV